ncbi:hypothetical protein [Brevibacterium aurantiacum]|uniref:HTH-type transcriptional repressor Sco4008 C-terminal domain-containing protein n=1 Tax=Brevibacterium aurantiacum TaxID=273384 RepID=A0A556C3S7_BREAU|nr:hypothetical protein [Brevibacterium aurantiacum]TSI12124.1 hypothetical protein FO013_20830 [Brevibacterium aurantiacum]
MERIATRAKSNVRLIYAYYGTKSSLFDMALPQALRCMAENVPPRPDDLTAWAGDVFDHHQWYPEVLRPSMWAQLECPEAATEPFDSHREQTLASAMGESNPLSPIDVLVFVYALAQAWGAVSGRVDSA